MFHYVMQSASVQYVLSNTYMESFLTRCNERYAWPWQSKMTKFQRKKRMFEVICCPTVQRSEGLKQYGKQLNWQTSTFSLKGNQNDKAYNKGKGYCVCTAMYAFVLSLNDIALLKSRNITARNPCKHRSTNLTYNQCIQGKYTH